MINFVAVLLLESVYSSDMFQRHSTDLPANLNCNFKRQHILNKYNKAKRLLPHNNHSPILIAVLGPKQWSMPYHFNNILTP